MVIFLYGSDSYRSKKKLEEIIKKYKDIHKSGLNLIFLNANQVKFIDLNDVLKISSMFSEKKLVVLKNIFLNKDFQENFLKEIKNLQSLKDVIVIYEEQEIDERLKISKVLIKECKSQNFKLLDIKGLRSWVLKEFDNHKTKINIDALNLLLSYIGNDLWRMENEIKKLSDYKKGLVIKKEDVSLLIKPQIETDIFKTIDALAARNKKQSLGFIQKHLDSGESPLYLLSMITYQFRNLLLVKELAEKGMMYGSIIKKTGLHPFVVKKTYFAANQFTFEELKKIYRRIFQIDFYIKSGKIEAETALNLLVFEI